MPGLAAAGGMAIPCLADASSLRRGATSLWLVRSGVPAFFLFLPVCRNAASGSIRSPRAGGNWLSRGVARGVIHVFAGGPGRTLYKAALDLDQFVDLHVCNLETPASLAQMPSPAGCADQVQPAPFKETERSPSDALEVQSPEATTTAPSTLNAHWWGNAYWSGGHHGLSVHTDVRWSKAVGLAHNYMGYF